MAATEKMNLPLETEGKQANNEVILLSPIHLSCLQKVLSTFRNKLVKQNSPISAEWLDLFWISDLVKLTAKVSYHILNKMQA